MLTKDYFMARDYKDNAYDLADRDERLWSERGLASLASKADEIAPIKSNDDLVASLGIEFDEEE